jgi:hypothetical protein
VADLDGKDVARQIATFVQEIERIKLIPGEIGSTVSGKYQPLAVWLKNQAADEVPTTFAFIETLIGPLPDSARQYSTFWTGRAATSPTHVWKRAWEAASYHVASVSLREGTVTFRRNWAPGPHAPDVGITTKYWWVNQGTTYSLESAGGYALRIA